jgi:hypothetical protein
MTSGRRRLWRVWRVGGSDGVRRRSRVTDALGTSVTFVTSVAPMTSLVSAASVA